MAIRSSDLRYLFIVDRRAAGANEFGQPSGEWAELTRMRGAVDPIESNVEIFQALQLGFEASARVRCRYKPILRTVTSRDRLRIGATYLLDIRAVIIDVGPSREIHFIVVSHTG
jgi:head-tail adaptor